MIYKIDKFESSDTNIVTRFLIALYNLEIYGINDANMWDLQEARDFGKRYASNKNIHG
jgi:hypothetical protein